MKPKLTLVSGCFGKEMSDWVSQRFADDLDTALLIVASSPQAQSRALEFSQMPEIDLTSLQGKILPLHAFVTSLGDTAPRSAALINRAFQRMIVAEIVRSVIRPEDFFGAMLEAPGFVSAFIERLRELKLAGVTPDILDSCSLNASKILVSPSFLKKSDEISRLFRSYLEFLSTHGLQDEEDQILSSTERLITEKAGFPFSTRTILVDGFYRFTRAQRDLLAAISTRLTLEHGADCELIVTLPIEPERELLFAAPLNTLQTLRDEFEVAEIELPGRNETYAGALHFLRRELFSPQPKSPRNALQIKESSQKIQIFDAPNSYVEAEMTAREFLRLHQTGDYQWSDFAIILRTMGDYTPILSAVFERYGIPLSADGPISLLDNPLLKTALSMLKVVRFGWRRDDLIAFLKSSYITRNKLDADLLRLRARSKAVREGRENWLRLVGIEESAEEAHQPGQQKNSLPTSSTSQIALLSEIDLRFQTECRSPSDFVETLKEAISEFGMDARSQQGDLLGRERDSQALKEGLDILGAMTRMAQIGKRFQMSLAEFYDEVSVGWSGAVTIGVSQKDHVRVADPFDARQSPIRVASVMGLTERVFPRRVTEDPFFRDDERAALREAGGIELEESRLQADDERFLFYLAATAPTERLTFSYPRSSKESDTLPSFYLDEVRAIFSNAEPNPLEIVSRTLADVAPRMEETVNSADRALAACADLFDPGNEAGTAGLEGKIGRAFESLKFSLSQKLSAVPTRHALESRSLPPLPKLVAEEIRSEFIHRKDIFPISDLETYARCPFQYLMRTVFKIRPETEGLDGAGQSNLLHTVLRRRFRKNRHLFADKPYAPEASAISDELKSTLDAILENESLDISPVHLNILKRKMGEDFDSFATRESRFGEQFTITPSHFHLTFGTDLAAGRNDPASTPEPLTLSLGEGEEQVQVSGVIDRVDLDSTGVRALLLDYDTGTPSEFSAVLNGTSLQAPLSLLAVENLFGMIGAGFCTDSMKETGRRRFFRTEHLNIRQFQPILPLDDAPNVKPLSREQFTDLTRTAIASAIRIVRDIKSAGVEARPGEHCRSCHFRDVCRTSLADGHDGE